ncbi:ORF1205 [White spot syndrome virus]|uniref:ORF1205 n=1 Tax=White spot syndrome virus TaxID=342409 RepID=A0A2D3I5D6_9VIRU|nr:ORF1205 [White spot syndrome virus]
MFIDTYFGVVAPGTFLYSAFKALSKPGVSSKRWKVPPSPVEIFPKSCINSLLSFNSLSVIALIFSVTFSLTVFSLITLATILLIVSSLSSFVPIIFSIVVSSFILPLIFSMN